MAFLNSHFSTGAISETFGQLNASDPFQTPEMPRTFLFAATSANDCLVDDLRAAVDDIRFATDEFDGVDVYTLVSGDADHIEAWSALTPGESELLVVVHDRSVGGAAAFGAEGQVSFSAAAGTAFTGMCQALLDRYGEPETRGGVDDLLGQSGESLLTTLASGKAYAGEGLSELAGFFRLSVALNALNAAGSALYDRLRRGGYLFDDLGDLIARLFPADYFNVLGSTVRQALEENADDGLAALAKRGEEMVEAMFGVMEQVLSHAPDFPWLLDQLWSAFNARLSASGQLLTRLLELADARTEFESALTESAGKQLWRELSDGLDATNSTNLGRTQELAIGGATIGQLPFLIGTVYQIVFDIVNTCVQLIKYGFYGMRGVANYLYAAATAKEPIQIAADDNLLSALIFDFDLDTFLSDDLPALIEKLKELTTAMLDSFIEHAAEYGKLVGGYVAKGMIAVGSGALALITKGYPSKSGLVSRLWWNAKQWFNIGTLIGPILVDLILMACSGGGTGVFSAAAKLGKLGKAGEVFRFTTQSKGMVKSAQFLSSLATKIPPSLKALGEKLLRQVWALAGRVGDVLTTLLSQANKRVGSPVGNQELTQIAGRLDLLYDVASVGHLFAALSFMLVGGEHSVVTPAGKVSAK